MAKTRSKGNTHRLGSIYVQPELAQQLDERAALEGRSINDVVRDAIRAYLKRKP